MMPPFGRLAFMTTALIGITFFVLQSWDTSLISCSSSLSWTPGKEQSSGHREATKLPTYGDGRGISYDLTTPPSTGCEAIVNELQNQLIRSYSSILKGIRYANLWGYLDKENRGDAAIWTAQQILLSTLGIETMEICRFVLASNYRDLSTGV